MILAILLFSFLSRRIFVLSECFFVEIGNCKYDGELPVVKFSCGTPTSSVPVYIGTIFLIPSRENEIFTYQAELCDGKYSTDGSGSRYLFNSWNMEWFDIFDRKSVMVGSGVFLGAKLMEESSYGFISACVDESVESPTIKKLEMAEETNLEAGGCTQMEFDCDFGKGQRLACNQTDNGSWNYGGVIYGGNFENEVTNWIIYGGYLTNSEIEGGTWNFTGRGKTTHGKYDVGNYVVTTDQGITTGLMTVAALENRAFVNLCFLE